MLICQYFMPKLKTKWKNSSKWRSGVGYISLSVYLYLSSSVAIYQKIYLVVHPMVSSKISVLQNAAITQLPRPLALVVVHYSSLIFRITAFICCIDEEISCKCYSWPLKFAIRYCGNIASAQVATWAPLIRHNTAATQLQQLWDSEKLS